MRFINRFAVPLFLGVLPIAYGAVPRNTVVILGSSTAQGAGASSNSASWAGLLAAAMAPRGYTVRNVSISGTNTSDSLARFDRDVAPYNPAFVILCTSIINEPAANAVQTFVQNTLSLIAKVESVGAIPILVPPFPNNGFTPSMYSSIRTIYATLAARGVPVLDFLDVTDDGQGHWVAGLTVDGTHPTDVGHRLLFDTIPLTLFEALQQAPPPVNPQGFGSWIQNSDGFTEGDLEIRPDTAMISWTVSFWTQPSSASTERTLLDLNSGWLQLRRSGAQWVLWNEGASLAAAVVRELPVFHHVALTYQSITGTLRLYLDGGLEMQTILPGAAPVTVAAIGADPMNSTRNATGDRFAAVILYRAPLAAGDIQSIRTLQPPWKSVAAWLPLVYSPDRPWFNLAASTVTAVAHGSWAWSSATVPLSKLPAPGVPAGR